MFKHKKRLGQNFLINKDIIKKIADIGIINKDTNIIEIGPGSGSLTEELLKRNAKQIFAIDFNTAIPKSNTVITAEWAWTFIDVPDTYTQQYGNKQQGGFIDIVQPIIKKKMFGFEKASFNAALRVEYVDWNIGTFNETGQNISDDVFSIVPAISFRTSPQTVLRLNYRYQWQTDILGNPASKTAAIQFGISSYF